MLAITHISTNVSRMLRNWSSTRPGMSIAALYSVTMPTHSSRNTMRASGRSNPANICLILSSQARLSNCMPFSVNERCRRPPLSRAPLHGDCRRAAWRRAAAHRWRAGVAGAGAGSAAGSRPSAQRHWPAGR
ncbi:hypothetical protein AAB984_26935, partial [Burkholderia contaminans]|uniref:hypothetical protein n=1 Tax=Burkholderia contaminans TaxID=488447 RepID=UPI003110C5AC